MLCDRKFIIRTVMLEHVSKIQAKSKIEQKLMDTFVHYSKDIMAYKSKRNLVVWGTSNKLTEVTAETKQF